MNRLNSKGFSMIELLVVLLIIGILAAVAAPIFLQNADKSRASEAVAGAGGIRSAERTYYAQNSAYVAVADGTTYFESAGANSTLLGVLIHGVKYFSAKCYTVAIPGAWTVTPTGISAPQDFVITVNGSAATNIALSADGVNGAANSTDVANIEVEMDNAGQTIYSTDGGTTWNKY